MVISNGYSPRHEKTGQIFSSTEADPTQSRRSVWKLFGPSSHGEDCNTSNCMMRRSISTHRTARARLLEL